MKGGPVLHNQDKKILVSGYVGYHHLVTIRKDELAFNPLKNRIEPSETELIKIKGKGNDWSCYFYNVKESSCIIYENRFLECRLLKCWDNSDLISIIGRDTLMRKDIINRDDPILSIIETHEKECPFNEINNLLYALPQEKNKSKLLVKLKDYVNKDITIRSYALSELGLKSEFEPFIFGRPLFKILSAYGISVHMSKDILRWYLPEPEDPLSGISEIKQKGRET